MSRTRFHGDRFRWFPLFLVDCSVLGRALRAGAWLTIAAMGVLGLVMAVAFNAFFDAFHGVFFEGDSWRFDERFTLQSCSTRTRPQPSGR